MPPLATVKGYLDLCRVSNLPTVWTNVLAAGVLAAAPLPTGGYLLASGALSCFYVAGMALNDFCDREHDRVHRPSRPIPSGRVPERAVLALTILLFAAGFLFLTFASSATALGGALLLSAAIVAYDLHHKGNRWSVLLMASCRFLVFVTAALAVAGRLSVAVLLAGALQFSYIVVLSLIARHENRRGASFAFPVIPTMLAGISLLDGIVLSFLANPWWLVAGGAGFLLTSAGQRWVRGD